MTASTVAAGQLRVVALVADRRATESPLWLVDAPDDRADVVTLDLAPDGVLDPERLDTSIDGLHVDLVMVDAGVGTDVRSVLRGLAGTLSRCHPQLRVRCAADLDFRDVEDVVEALGYWSSRDVSEGPDGRVARFST